MQLPTYCKSIETGQIRVLADGQQVLEGHAVIDIEELLQQLLGNAELVQLVHDAQTIEGTTGDSNPFDDPRYDFTKIEIDDCRPGDKVRICWNVDGYRFTDIAYIGMLPNIGDSEDLGMGCFFHCPEPQNPGGMGQAPGEFISLLQAAGNPLIVSIKPIKRR